MFSQLSQVTVIETREVTQRDEKGNDEGLSERFA